MNLKTHDFVSSLVVTPRNYLMGMKWPKPYGAVSPSDNLFSSVSSREGSNYT